MAPHHVKAKGILITVVEPAEALVVLCAGVVIDPDVARMADAHEGARGVNAHGVLPAVVLPFSALINIFTVGIIVSQWAEAILTNTAVSCLQVHTVGVLHAAVAL